MRGGLAGICVAAGMCASCAPMRSDGPPPEAPPTFDQMTEEQRLALWDFLPIGSSSSQCRAVVPTLGALRPEGGLGLEDAVAQVSLLDRQLRLEFNFLADTLYSCYYNSLASESAASGDSLYERLKAFYGSRLGTPECSESVDVDYTVRGCSWNADSVCVGLSSFHVETPYRTLGWGYQVCRNPRP